MTLSKTSQTKKIGRRRLASYPNFTVTIAEKLSSLQFVNYSSKVIEVFEVRADGKNTASGVDIPFGESAYTQSCASTLAERAVDAINLLKPSANYSQLGEYCTSSWTRFTARQIIKWLQANPEVILKRDGNVVISFETEVRFDPKKLLK